MFKHPIELRSDRFELYLLGRSVPLRDILSLELDDEGRVVSYTSAVHMGAHGKRLCPDCEDR